MKNITILALALTLILSGCAARQDSLPSGAEHYEKTVSLIVKRSCSLTNQTEYTGPPFPNKLLGTNAFLRSIKPKPTFLTLYQLYILTYYKADGLRNYDTAQDSEGNKIDVIVMYRDVGNRTGAGTMEYYEEHMIINFSRKGLQDFRQTGLSITITGEGDSAETVFLPAFYIAAFLDTVPPDEGMGI